ncbi:MAG: NAD(P)H-quinone dehydrogenase [Actinomycetaceae bacterium]|nr:NAD(P)H-quinone dehydrogenase [Actinomycetaceae bacterium]
MNQAGSEIVRKAARVVIIGGGPGGYEAATVAARLGAHVTVIEHNGLGGSAVLTDVVPSKTLIATAEWLSATEQARYLGIEIGGSHPQVNMNAVNNRVRQLASQQSADIQAALRSAGVNIIAGRGRLTGKFNEDGSREIQVHKNDGTATWLVADVVIVATGARPRELHTMQPDGERIFTWKQLYNLKEIPPRLIVVGSGVTGAEFAGAYQVLGSEVTLISSRDQLLPGEDQDAAALVEKTFTRRGMKVLSRARAAAVKTVPNGVVVTLEDGREISGTHCLVAVGAIPNTTDLGLAEAGVQTDKNGKILVDPMSRTSAFGVYAAGDCTASLPLASVAAKQGRTAVMHALGDAVEPLDLRKMAATIFTIPEVATVGLSEAAATAKGLAYKVEKLPLSRNPRAKMQGITEGFVKLLCLRESKEILGGVIVGPRASELIFTITLAITKRLSVDEISGAFTVYPSLSGTVAEVARSLRS